MPVTVPKQLSVCNRPRFARAKPGDQACGSRWRIFVYGRALSVYTDGTRDEKLLQRKN